MTLSFICTLAAASASAQTRADAILGDWIATQGGAISYVKISRSADATYMAQVYYVSDSKAPDGSTYLDEKNPDKSLRSVPIDKVVLFKGLKYNAEKDNWSGTKIYDPSRGIRANVTVSLPDADTIKLRGSVLGIGETVIWTRKNQ